MEKCRGFERQYEEPARLQLLLDLSTSPEETSFSERVAIWQDRQWGEEGREEKATPFDVSVPFDQQLVLLLSYRMGRLGILQVAICGIC